MWILGGTSLISSYSVSSAPLSSDLFKIAVYFFIAGMILLVLNLPVIQRRIPFFSMKSRQRRARAKLYLLARLFVCELRHNLYTQDLNDRDKREMAHRDFDAFVVKFRQTILYTTETDLRKMLDDIEKAIKQVQKTRGTSIVALAVFNETYRPVAEALIPALEHLIEQCEQDENSVR